MRQFVLIVSVFIAAILRSAVTHADGDASNWGTITKLYVDAKATVMRIEFSRAIINPGNCEGGDFYIRELDESAASERFLQVVLGAHLANKKVEFWIDGCTKAKWWGKTRPQIYDIYIGS